MAATAPAMDLCAREQQDAVGRGTDCIGQRPKEARPTGLAVELGPRGEQRQIAGGAGIGALTLLVIEGARARNLGSVQAQNFVLRLSEGRSPLAVGFLDFERACGLDIAALQPP